MENLFIEDSIKLKGKSKKIKGKIHQVNEDHKGVEVVESAKAIIFSSFQY